MSRIYPSRGLFQACRTGRGKIVAHSKWLNTLVVEMSDSMAINAWNHCRLSTPLNTCGGALIDTAGKNSAPGWR